MVRHWLLMLAFKGSNPFVPEIQKGSLGEKGKHDGFKIRSLLKVTGSSPVASNFFISKISD
uniref:Putative orf60 protein n=1 Tax=Chondrus crispus TaxID=2769 RepID=Q36334_CHOCR|nr:putative orf60 [Chondrus crispus]